MRRDRHWARDRTSYPSTAMLPLELQNVKGALERGRAPLALDCSIVVAPFTTSLVSVLKVGIGASPSPPRTGLRRSRTSGRRSSDGSATAWHLPHRARRSRPFKRVLGSAPSVWRTSTLPPRARDALRHQKCARATSSSNPTTTARIALSSSMSMESSPSLVFLDVDKKSPGSRGAPETPIRSARSKSGRINVCRSSALAAGEGREAMTEGLLHLLVGHARER